MTGFIEENQIESHLGLIWVRPTDAALLKALEAYNPTAPWVRAYAPANRAAWDEASPFTLEG